MLAPDVLVRSAGFGWQGIHPADDEGLCDTTLDEDAWTQLRARLRAGLLERCADDRLRQALLWQNPTFVRDGLPRLARSAGTDSPALRTRERILLRYLLRYQGRAESIGFFGPAGWGRLGAGPEPVRTTHAEPSWLVIVESWAVTAVAAALAADPRLRGELTTWPLPGTWTAGRTAVRGARRHRLTDDEAAVLDALTGPSTTRELIGATGLDEERTRVAVDALDAAGLVHHGWHVDTELDAWQQLREQVAALQAGPARDDALSSWDGIDEAVTAARAARTADELEAALREVNARFRAVTGLRGRRVPDAEAPRGLTVPTPLGGHDVRVELGAEVTDDLRELCAALAPAARWFCAAAGRVFDATLAEYLGRLRDELGDPEPRLGAAYSAAYALLEAPGVLDATVEDLAARWSRVLTADGAVVSAPDEDVDLAARAAAAGTTPAALVAAAFPADLADVPWGSGRLHSPDVLVGVGVDGTHRVVLGEVHVGNVTADAQLCSSLPGGRAAITRTYTVLGSAERPRYFVLPTLGSGISALNDPVPYVGDAGCHYLSPGALHAERRPGGPTYPMADCRVRSTPDGEQVVLPDGRLVPLLTVLGEVVSHVVASMFHLVPPEASAPRVRLGPRTVLQRRRWVLDVDALRVGLTGDDRLDVPALVRRLRSEGVPRWSFWRTRPGTKPVLLDLHHALTVDLLLTALHSTDDGARLQVVEMSPEPDELWFPGPDGRGRAVSELRLVFADL